MAAVPGTPGTPITINGFQCWDESAYEQFDAKTGITCYRTILCYCRDRIALMESLFGYPVVAGAPFTTPASYPDAPGATVAKCTTAQQPGTGGTFKGPNGMIATQFSRLTIQYNPPTISGQLPTYSPNLITCDFEADVFQIPGNTLIFSSSGATSSDPFAKFIPTARLVIPRSSLISFNGAGIFTQLATINSTGFYGSNQYRTLFLGAPTKERYTVSDQYVWDREFHFKVRSNDSSVPHFNQGWDVTVPGFADYDSSTLPYGTSDLNSIVTF